MLSHKLSAAVALSALAMTGAAEEVLGVYMFHRHGDRTAKAWKPVNLTALGADQVHSSGAFYHDRYVAADSDRKIHKLSSSSAVLAQIDTTAPIDNVLQNSATVFLQGLYPPTKQVETLANGTKVEAPFDGYQYIPVNSVESAASAKDSENSAWLQGNSGCGNAEVSSNAYFESKEYLSTFDDTESFYSRLLPVINGTYSEEEANFKNGYAIFDLINVARIHNSSIPSDNLLTKSTVNELYSLASTHEWNLAYNSTEPVRAIAGSVLAGQILEALDPIVKGESGPRFNVQFGAYGTFMAFFGLANLQKASPDFMGVCDYASSMVFELVTNATDPAPEDVSVRFYFSNGTAAENEPKLFPLFGQDKTTLSWDDFKSGMADFAIEDTDHWCKLCGNTDGTCASSANTTSSDSGEDSSQCGSGSDNGISKPVAGVIGALVTLVVVLGVEAAILLFGGLRLAKKSTLTGADSAPSPGGVKA